MGVNEGTASSWKGGEGMFKCGLCVMKDVVDVRNENEKLKQEMVRMKNENVTTWAAIAKRMTYEKTTGIYGRNLLVTYGKCLSMAVPAMSTRPRTSALRMPSTHPVIRHANHR